MRSHNPDPAIIIQCIKQTRLQAGLSREEVARRMGISQDVVWEWECGKRLMDFAELRRYCQAIGISIHDFIAKLEDILCAAVD